MPYKNIEDRRAWNARNKDKAKEYKERWKHSDAGKAYIAKQKQARAIQAEINKSLREQYKIDNAEKIAAEKQCKHRRYRTRKRLEAIEALGGSCNWCGIDDADVLEFDHIVSLQRRTNGIRQGGDTWKEVLKLKNPEQVFQILCSNCHTKKTRQCNEFAPLIVGSFEAMPPQVTRNRR